MAALTDFQRKIVDEFLQKRKGCVSIPMGCGKTIIALETTTKIQGDGSCLVILSPTLIKSWVHELNKFYGSSISYQIYHSSVLKRMQMQSFVPTANVVFTTAEMLAKRYNELHVRDKFQTSRLEDRGGQFPVHVNYYHVPTKPFLPAIANGVMGGFFFTQTWRCIVIDEVQTYTNVTSARCQAISSVHAEYRLALSGTPICEPKAECLLGYHTIIGDGSFPNCVPDASEFIRKDTFTGLNKTMVVRTMNQADFTLPDLSEIIINHTLSQEETIIYNSLKSIIKSMNKTLRLLKRDNDTLMTRRFNAYLLGMITYTRQFVVCPLVPYATMAVEMTNMTKTNEMIDAFRSELAELPLQEWFQNPNASKSSRIEAVLGVLERHREERMIVFTCFRVTLNVIAHYLPSTRPQFVISASQTPAKRAVVLDKFAKSKNGILLLTYAVGAEGLNLQHTSIVLLVDVWWNCSKTSQAIARVLRRGQTKPVTAYMFTSETGIEKGLFIKHVDKIKSIRELSVGKLSTKIKTLKTADILQLITTDETTRLLSDSLKETKKKE